MYFDSWNGPIHTDDADGKVVNEHVIARFLQTGWYLVTVQVRGSDLRAVQLFVVVQHAFKRERQEFLRTTVVTVGR